jgi:tRNA-dihydrouridine synthase
MRMHPRQHSRIITVHALNVDLRILKGDYLRYHNAGKDEKWYHLRCMSSDCDTVVNNNNGTVTNTPSNLFRQQLFLPCQPNTPITTVMAPMVSSSDYAFRCLVRQYNGATCSSDGTNLLTFTQMLHAHNLIRDGTFYRNHYDLYEYRDDNDRSYKEHGVPELTESQRNVYTHNNYPSIDRWYAPPSATATRGPVIAQLAGYDVATVVKAAQKIVHSTRGQIAGIDLNLGCPQNIARKGNYGAYLMENHPSTACSILAALRKALPSTVAVSAKIRLPYNPNDQNLRLQQLCDTGINFLTIHGRDYTENKITVRHVHVHRLKDAIETVNEYSNYCVPVIVNGGIEFESDAIQLQAETGAAAVMSSEALLEKPSLLGEIKMFQDEQSSTSLSPSSIKPPKQRFTDQIQSATDYIRWCYYMPPLSSGLGNKGGSFNVVRGHLFKILYRYLNDEMNTDLRDWLADGYTMQRLDHAQALVQTLHERYDSFTDIEWENNLLSSKIPESTWYRRHRSSSIFVHQRIKPNPNEDRKVQLSTPTTEVSVNDRKTMIREKIEKLRNQKKMFL